MKQKVGLHIRVTEGLTLAFQYAAILQVPWFQFFFLEQQTGNYVHLDEEVINAVTEVMKTSSIVPYVHASYWINLASGKTRGGQYVLRKECKFALSLGITRIVLHPGSASGDITKEQGIGNLVRRAKRILAAFPEIILILENTAFGKKTLGGSIEELAHIGNAINNPQQVRYCIDTAHAYAYGYDIETLEGYEEFINELETHIGLDAIELIHLNDTADECGSKKDKHAIFGTGFLKQALPRILQDVRLAHIPMIAELPPMDPVQERHLLERMSLLVKGT